MQSALDMQTWFDTQAESFPRILAVAALGWNTLLSLQPASSDRMQLHPVSCFSLAVLNPTVRAAAPPAAPPANACRSSVWLTAPPPRGSAPAAAPATIERDSCKWPNNIALYTFFQGGFCWEKNSAESAASLWLSANSHASCSQ